jgi:hypothetical protein
VREPDPLPHAHTASPYVPALSQSQARGVLHFLLDNAPCEDLASVWSLFGELHGIELLIAIDQIEGELYGDALIDMIGKPDRQRIGADLDRLRQAVTVPEEDSALAALLLSRPVTDQPSVQGLPSAPEARSESEALVSAEHPLNEDALAVLNQCIEDVQAQGPQVPSGTRARLPRLQLTSRSPVLDLRVEVYRQALNDGGVQGLEQVLCRLPPLQQWRVMTELLEDAVLLGRHPRLAAIADLVYRHYIATSGGDRPLERLRHWHRFQSRGRPLNEHELLLVPTDFEPEAWIRLLRLMVFQRHPQPCRARNELNDIIDLYKQSLGVQTARDHAEGAWLDAVRVALRQAASGHELLKALQMRLGNDANVALALITGLAHSQDFDDGQRLVLRRAAAIHMAKHDHNLPCIAMPSLQATTPQKLHVLCPKAPTDPKAPQAVRDRYQELVDRWTLHAPLVDSDCQKVRRLLAAPFPAKPDPTGGEGVIELTPGEQCDYLLCTLELPPKRVELALLKVAQSCQGLDDQALYLLARRLLSELKYSERNYAGRNQPMNWCEILGQFLAGLVRNGLREGLSHGVALWSLRVAVKALFGLVGGYALPLVSVGSFILTLWTRRHLHAMKSPDYQLNPSTVVEVLIEIAPVLNAPALIGVLLATAAGAVLPFDLAEPLYLMNLVRLLRQIMQSGSQPWAYNLRLTDRRGAGVLAQTTFFSNCLRDALYLGSSVGTLVYLSRYLEGVMAAWGPAQTLGQELFHAAVEVVPSMTNEFVDGLNPDLAILGARLVAWVGGLLGRWEDDYMLQPSAPLAWDAVDKHMAIQGLGRSFVSPQDLVRVAKDLTTGGLSDLFLWLVALLNGFLGALRGRHLSYMMTTDPQASALPPADGSPFKGLSFKGAPLQNPDGLLVGLYYLAALAGHGVQRGADWLLHRGPAPAQIHQVVPPQVLRGDGTPTKVLDNPRVQALLQSQRGRSKGAGPDVSDSQSVDRDVDGSEEDDAQQQVDLSGGATPVLGRIPGGDDSSEHSSPLVDLSVGTPRLPRFPAELPSNDFSEQ